MKKLKLFLIIHSKYKKINPELTLKFDSWKKISEISYKTMYIFQSNQQKVSDYSYN